jgi:hypothetical protein
MKEPRGLGPRGGRQQNSSKPVRSDRTSAPAGQVFADPPSATEAITTAHKHRNHKRRGQWQWVHCGRDLLGIVQEQENGTWAVIKLGVIVSTYPTREQAIAALEIEAKSR